MPRRLAPLVVLLAIGFGGLAAPGSPAPDALKPEDFVFVQKGTLPVILSAPHGGRKPVPDVPERKGPGTATEKFVTVRDENTAEVAEKLAAEVERKLGGKPWVVIARFERRFVDANRTPEGAYESDRAKPYYDAYHGSLAAACKAVKEKFGRGLLLDLHGQALYPDSICRGTRNGKTVTLLTDRFGGRALTGKHSVLGRMEADGYKVVPACDAPPAAKEEPNFAGGHIVATYGSHTGYAIDAIQVELGSNYRARDTYARTARDLADAVVAFHDEYLTDPEK